MIFSVPLYRSQTIRGTALGFTNASQDTISAHIPLEVVQRYYLASVSRRANYTPSRRHLSLSHLVVPKRACSDYCMVMIKETGHRWSNFQARIQLDPTDCPSPSDQGSACVCPYGISAVPPSSRAPSDNATPFWECSVRSATYSCA
jgi:hypothetical protein